MDAGYKKFTASGGTVPLAVVTVELCTHCKQNKPVVVRNEMGVFCSDSCSKEERISRIQARVKQWHSDNNNRAIAEGRPTLYQRILHKPEKIDISDDVNSLIAEIELSTKQFEEKLKEYKKNPLNSFKQNLHKIAKTIFGKLVDLCFTLRAHKSYRWTRMDTKERAFILHYFFKDFPETLLEKAVKKQQDISDGRARAFRGAMSDYASNHPGAFGDS